MQCQNCKNDFAITNDDRAFYEKIGVPPPTFCPSCRLQRRLAWRNERGFHHRQCDLCRKPIIAIYSRDSRFPVYCRECYWSDNWDAAEYGRDYDFNRPFFAQFHDLLMSVPAIALQVSNSENCDYANQIGYCKNCYLVNSASYNEDCAYAYRILNSRQVLDSSFILKCDNCYECYECSGCSSVQYSDNCADSFDLQFCYDARNSNHCFMSANLRGRSYVFRNRQMTRASYEQALKEVALGSAGGVALLKQEFKNMKASSLHAYANLRSSVSSSGQTIEHCKDVRHSFNIADSENCSYCLYLNDAKDTYDVNNGCCTMEMCYEVSTTGIKCARILFSADIWPEARDISYSVSCRNGASDLFGCVGIKKGRYRVMNKQYSKDEYESLVTRIIEQMKHMPYSDSKGRVYGYGEFFPAELAPVPYNESPAQDYFPLTQKEASNQGLVWATGSGAAPRVTMENGRLPDAIADAGDDIAAEVIECGYAGDGRERCTGAFRIIPQELEFCRKNTIPLPRYCPNCRQSQRLAKRNPMNLWRRRCMCGLPGAAYQNMAAENHNHSGSCEQEFETTYRPGDTRTIYCLECYQAEVV